MSAKCDPDFTSILLLNQPYLICGVGTGELPPPPMIVQAVPYRFLKRELYHVWNLLLGISLPLNLFTSSHALLNYVFPLLSILTKILSPQGIGLVIMWNFTCTYFLPIISENVKKIVRIWHYLLAWILPWKSVLP